MSKSIVAVYCGGRGSGKTLSASAEGAIAMIAGRRVWSNYPIHIGFKDSSGNITHHKSTLIDMPDLIAIQSKDEIRDGLVILDEWNLFCNSRRSGALSNIIFSGVVQLIRKRKLSFLITAQDFHTLDRNIRWQCDVVVQCFDLSFKYKNLKEGQVISQMISDWSGVYTGRPIEFRWQNIRDEWARNTRTRLFLKASKFFGCYDTGFEYDVLKTMSQKYTLQRQESVIGFGDNGGFDARLLDEYKMILRDQGVNRVSVDDMQSALDDMGLKGSLRGDLGKKLKASGFQYKQTRNGNFYEFEN